MAKSSESPEVKSILSEAKRIIEQAGKRSDVLEAGRIFSRRIANEGGNEALDDLNQLLNARLAAVDPSLKRPHVERGCYVAPTPPIGEIVLWMDNNNRAKAVPAMVLTAEEPGKLELQIFRGGNAAFPGATRMNGVRHCTDPIHDKANNPTTMTTGSWDYTERVKRVPDEDYDAARAVIEKREEVARRAKAEQLERERNAKLVDEMSKQAVDNLQTV